MVATLVPILPLTLTMMPLEELLRTLLRVLVQPSFVIRTGAGALASRPVLLRPRLAVQEFPRPAGLV
jgi:hypothetical protein